MCEVFNASVLCNMSFRNFVEVLISFPWGWGLSWPMQLGTTTLSKLQTVGPGPLCAGRR